MCGTFLRPRWRGNLTALCDPCESEPIKKLDDRNAHELFLSHIKNEVSLHMYVTTNMSSLRPERESEIAQLITSGQVCDIIDSQNMMIERLDAEVQRLHEIVARSRGIMYTTAFAI